MAACKLEVAGSQEEEHIPTLASVDNPLHSYPKSIS